MQEVLVKIGGQDSQKEKQQYHPGESIAESPDHNCNTQMPDRYKDMPGQLTWLFGVGRIGAVRKRCQTATIQCATTTK